MASTIIPALIVVDMQEDFCEPHGSLAVQNGREIAPKINELLNYPGWKLRVATRDVHPPNHISFASNHQDKKAFVSSHTIRNPENEGGTQTTLLWPDHCVENTFGAQIIPEINSSKFDIIISKGTDPRVESYSGFGPPFRNPRVSMSDLDAKLKAAGITHVFCVGLAYDFCVKCTAVDAVEFGYRSYLVEDATRGVHHGAENVERLRDELKGAGVEVVGMEDEVLRGVREGRA
ncbi:uncharacterized protein MYCFIDRAFT_154146 [Pseudocercospora fijiensis CIRAD86]|uniref:nicotinamidase n=1 Tax=Pseudocercospora fijiensis (strain CIRAD86) TaxID=383855 RepID=M3B2F3_PSEFD|nr:uncharacterized protein MYCFIDRAFT_154146 [Pseudocercospora fijiensis CIRAD86]EME83587.1 hypothetical protein MYCFIDRAFT_154146 [Pseudocercospora fijiensis CIRAD86]